MAKRGRPRNFDRDEALGKAAHLFWERGYDGTSIANLTEVLALNPPSIYAAFGSKEELFRESVEQYLKTEGAVIVDAIDAASSAIEAARAMLHVSAKEFARQDQPRGCMVVLDALHEHDKNCSVKSVLTALRVANIKRLTEKFESDVARGVLPTDRDWQPVATYFVTVQQGMAIRARDGADEKTLSAVAECALAAWPAISGESATSSSDYRIPISNTQHQIL